MHPTTVGGAGAIGLGLRRARAFLNDACGRARFVAGKSLAVHIGSPLAPGLLPSHPNARVFLPALEQPELAVHWVRFSGAAPTTLGKSLAGPFAASCGGRFARLLLDD